MGAKASESKVAIPDRSRVWRKRWTVAK